MAQMCHWIVTNLTVPFQSSDSDGTLDWLPSLFSAKGSKETGITEVMPYLPPSPPPKTGYHRYVFVLLAPGTEEGIGIQKELTKPKDRPHWGYGKVGAGVREWADENDLVVVGEQTAFKMLQKFSLTWTRCQFFLFQEQEAMNHPDNLVRNVQVKDVRKHPIWE